jgi:hypothetical protein
MTELRLRRSELHWREIDESVIALEVRGSTYLAANPAGTLLWRELATGSTRERLAATLVDAYGIDCERARADADSFLSEMAAQGLLEL